MRIKRHKGFRRSLRFYRLHFGVVEPYKVVVDGPFISQSLQGKLNIREQLPKLLNGARITPMVTGCMLHELRNLGDKGKGALHIAKSYYRVKCNHHQPLTAAECIKEQIGQDNERKLFVATQDNELGQHLRGIPGCPVIRLNQQTPFLEEPSAASKDLGSARTSKNKQVGAWEKQKLPELRQKEVIAAAKASQGPKKRKGPKGVNPLACQRKKRKEAPAPAESAPAAQSQDAEAAPPKAKRVRSRRMGTVTRAEMQERLAQRAAADPEAAADSA